MKNIVTFILSTFIGIIISNAQDEIKPIGGVNFEDVKMTESEKYPDAEAIVLFDHGASRFMEDSEGGFDVEFTRHTRIKVFKKAGVGFGEIEIPIYQENNIYEKITKIEGYTFNINENGGLERSVLDAENQKFEEKSETGWVTRKYAMPNVREGSIIDVKYTISSPYVFNLRDWNFQSTIPTIYSEYDVSMIPFYQYTFIMQGAGKFDFNDSKESMYSRRYAGIEFKDLKNRYALRDIPAFKDEEFISGINDYIIKIDFQLSKIIFPNGGTRKIITTWPDMIKDLNKSASFGKYIKGMEKKSKELLLEINLVDKSEEEKIKLITDYVKQNYSWNGYHGIYASESSKDFLNQKKGNVSEINLMLVAMLKNVGIEAYPVILSTRGHGHINSDFPFFHYFNYVIVIAGANKNFLLDATENLLPYNLLPSKCYNGKGLIINDENVEWANLINTNKSGTETYLEYEINADTNHIRVGFKNKSSGYDAQNYRNKSIENKLSDQFSYLEITNIDSISTSNIDIVDDKFIISFDFDAEISHTEKNIYFAPFFNIPLSTNPFSQNTRSLPIDIENKKSRTYYSSIALPENYRIKSLPENINLNNKIVKISYTAVENAANHIIVSASYEYMQSVYSTTDYKQLKYYINEVIKKFNEKIVLEKIE